MSDAPACDKCEGTGMCNNGPETSGIGRPDWFEEWPCPSCTPRQTRTLAAMTWHHHHDGDDPGE